MEQGIIGLLGVALGGAGTYYIQKQSWRTQELQNLRLQISSTYLLIWDEDEGRIKLKAHFQNIKVRLDILGFDPNILNPYAKAAMDCWKEYFNETDGGNVHGGISTTLMNKFEQKEKLLEAKLKG